MYLVDTNVVSEARRNTPQAVSWLRAAPPSSIYLSVITLGEIMKGVALKERSDRQAAGHLAEWLRETGRISPAGSCRSRTTLQSNGAGSPRSGRAATLTDSSRRQRKFTD